MICPKCCNEGVKNECLGKEFYYCRTCKDEIYPGTLNDAAAGVLIKIPDSMTCARYVVAPSSPTVQPGYKLKYKVGDKVQFTDMWGKAHVMDIVFVDTTSKTPYTCLRKNGLQDDFAEDELSLYAAPQAVGASGAFTVGQLVRSRYTGEKGKVLDVRPSGELDIEALTGMDKGRRIDYVDPSGVEVDV